MIRIGCAAGQLSGDAEESPRWWRLDFLPTLGVFQEAGHREMNRRCFRDVIYGCFNSEVTRLRRVRRAIVAGWH